MDQPEFWFSADYAEARAKFRAAAERAGAALCVHRNPNARQPDGNDLTTDVARLGPAPDKASKVLIASSGTHGVEGFCGSGCQVGMLDSGAVDLLPPDCALVLVHAINPYGFAWLRRVTEDNIDLNRNNLDHSAGHPANANYAEVHAWLTPREWNGPERDRADAAIGAYIGERGLFAFQEAVSGGQYEFPDGLFFGGTELSWSARTWKAIVEAHCRGAERVAHLDFHTGLGEYGACEIISVEGSDGKGADRARQWYGDEVKSPERNDSLSAVVTGSMENGFNGLAGETEVTAVALEYGIRPVTEVLEALRADNWLHLYGDPASEEGKAIKRQIRDAFYGDTPEWKRMIWATADRVVRQAAAGLAGRQSMSAPTAEVILPSPDFDATLAFFRETLGFRLDSIHPADDPAIASLSGYGLRLRLDRDAEGPPPSLRIASANPAALLDGAREVTAPNGATVTVVDADPPLDLPPLDQRLTVCRAYGEGGGWGVGRAGMLYRDLIPEREGGRFIASHIRIPDGGPVPDNVHFHKIRFQMIYNYKGWVRLVYEDQGEPFVMGPGDCVLQPPEIRHRVLECSDGLEVIEIGCPAEHMTLLDHDLPLPTGRHLPERDYGGQRFVLHRAEGAGWAPADLAGFEARDLGIAGATGGLAEVAVLRQVADDIDVSVRHSGEFLFHFVLDGRLTLSVDGREPDDMAAGDSFTLPGGLPCRIAAASGSLELLRIRLP